jgi:nanoRNase/pAp phosphatase (c-di-AMP/oligoRNAs hydrolase)
MQTQLLTRSAQLLDTVSGSERVLAITHDNPDPDAIASGWALKCLIERKAGVPTRLVGAGGIVRAENRQMVKLLQAPIELVQDLEHMEGVAAFLVDCGYGASNHLLADSGLRPTGVIDHHSCGRQSLRLAFKDVRPRVVATATITSSYLREQHVEPSPELATALLYAIRSETKGGETFHSRLDRSIISWLSRYANPSLLAEIENAPVPRGYFADLVLALQNAFVYDGAALCFLPRAEGSETVGEVADLIARCDEVRCVLCAAAVGDDLFLSVRTDKNSRSAADLVQTVLRDLGRGGGHQQRAGGKIPGAGTANLEELCDKLRIRWLAACDVECKRGTRLVALREIVSNL